MSLHDWTFHGSRHDDWFRDGAWYNSDGWLLDTSGRGEGWGLHALKVQKLQTSDSRAGTRLASEQREVVNNCGGAWLPFCMIAWRCEGSGHCSDTKTTVAKDPWMCEVSLGNRWGQLSQKRKCYLLPDVISLVTGTILTMGEGLANCAVEVTKSRTQPSVVGNLK